MSFADEVKKEAAAQKELKAQGKPIPPELKKYARRSGVVVCIVAGIGSALILGIGMSTGTYYVGFILFFAVLAVMGIIQAITGRSLLQKK